MRQPGLGWRLAGDQAPDHGCDAEQPLILDVDATLVGSDDGTRDQPVTPPTLTLEQLDGIFERFVVEDWRQVAESIEGWSTVAVVNRRGRQPSGPLTAEYSLQVEVADAAAVLREFTTVKTLFGWSYGGLIVLELANTLAIPHVIAYEPVIHPFGARVLPALQLAADSEDWDATVEIVTRRIAGMDPEVVDGLRADSGLWVEMRRLGEPVYAETAALNDAGDSNQLAVKAKRVDLILGSNDREESPYGTTFSDVSAKVAHAEAHDLPGQGHMVHLEAPSALAALLDQLRSANEAPRSGD